MRHRGRHDGAVRVTIADVAAAANVSTATVSRALTRPGRVRKGLAERVRRVAAELGYVPNAAARALSSLRSGEVGVLVDGLHRQGRIVSSLAAALNAAGVAVRLADAGGSATARARALATFADQDMEAAFVIGGAAATGGSPLSLVRVGGASAGDIDPAIEAAAAWVVAYLRGLGHSRFALVAATEANPESDRFLRAASDALHGPGMPRPWRLKADPLHLGPVLAGAGAGHPTAVVCGDDLGALRVLRARRTRGVPVPGGCSVVGFGDRPFAGDAVPPLTSVRIPEAALGVAAATHWLAARAGQPMPRPVSLPCKLVVRRSTGPAPG